MTYFLLQNFSQKFKTSFPSAKAVIVYLTASDASSETPSTKC